MTTPAMEKPLTPAEMERLTDHMSPYDRSLFQRALFAAQAEGRKQGLREAAAFDGPDLQTGEGESLAAAIEQLKEK